jgi:hypothetical protein
MEERSGAPVAPRDADSESGAITRFLEGDNMRPEIEMLKRRLARLERENQRLKTVLVGLALPLAGLFSMGFSAKPRTIETEEIVVSDDHGRARLTIGTPQAVGAAFDMQPANRRSGLAMSTLKRKSHGLRREVRSGETG